MGGFDSRIVMTRNPSPSSEFRLDRLLGRQVIAANNRPLGRVEEFRAEKRGTGCVITEYVIGVAGLAERLGWGSNCCSVASAAALLPGGIRSISATRIARG